MLVFVSESGVQQLDPSAEMVSKQETNDECSLLNHYKASILSTHRVRHRYLSFFTADPGCVCSMASSSFLSAWGEQRKI